MELIGVCGLAEVFPPTSKVVIKDPNGVCCETLALEWEVLEITTARDIDAGPPFPFIRSLNG